MAQSRHTQSELVTVLVQWLDIGHRGIPPPFATLARDGDDAGMKESLLKSNPSLREDPRRDAALHRSAASSSAVEGIVKPFAKPSRSPGEPRKGAKSAKSRG